MNEDKCDYFPQKRKKKNPIIASIFENQNKIQG